jgi:hypothetical protein
MINLKYIIAEYYYNSLLPYQIFMKNETFINL